MKTKLIFMVSLLILGALVAFAVLFTVHHSGHCTDVECEICAQIQNVKKLINSLLFTAVLVGIFTATVYVLCCTDSYTDTEFFTPVNLKVKLSN